MTLPNYAEAAPDLRQRCALGISDQRMTLQEAIDAYHGGDTLIVDEEIRPIGRAAAEQLFGMVGLNVKTIGELSGHPDIQRAMALAKLSDVEEEKRANVVLARGRQVDEEQRVIDSFITSGFMPPNNSEVLTRLGEVLPGDAQIHSAVIHGRRMNLRVVSPSWTHDIGHGDTAYSGLVIRNDELARTSTMVRVGVARVACFNWSILDEPVLEFSEGVMTWDVLGNVLQDAVGRLNSLAAGVVSTMRSFHDIEVEDVAGMLRVICGEQGLPQYVEDEALRWWEATGGHNSLFWTHQSVAAAVSRMTSGKRQQWDRRERVEVQTYNMARSFAEQGRLEVCTCPRCHRPLREYAIDGDFVALGGGNGQDH